MRKISIALFVFALTIVSQAQVTLGDMAPAFKLRNVDNQHVALSDYKQEEGVILVFTCNHCPYAKFYEERIKDLNKNYASKNFPVVAINPNDSVQYKEDGFSYMVEKKYDFPYLLDNEGIHKAYGATKTPHVFLLAKADAGFKVVYIGAIDDSPQDASAVQVKYLENAIAAVKEGKTPSPALTKAIGCSIKPFGVD